MDFKLPPYEVNMIMTAKSLGQLVSWGQKFHKIPEEWKKTKGNKAIVYVIDTGIDPNHEDLIGKVKYGMDMTGSPVGFHDVSGHGTHVGGIISANDNDFGVVGVAPDAILYAAKGLSDEGTGRNSWIAKLIYMAADHDIDRYKIINMSLGGPTFSQEIEDALKYAESKGCILLCAAGNEGEEPGEISYPARSKYAIAVASHTEDGSISDFSTRGENIDVTAPGSNIISTYPNNQYASLSGTSMATPFVSGLVALKVSYDQDFAELPIHLRNEYMRSALRATADDILETGTDIKSGYGLVDPDEFMDAIGDPEEKPDCPPCICEEPTPTRFWDWTWFAIALGGTFLGFLIGKI